MKFAKAENYEGSERRRDIMKWKKRDEQVTERMEEGESLRYEVCKK